MALRMLTSLLHTFRPLVAPACTSLLVVDGISKFDDSRLRVAYVGNQINFTYLRDLFFRESTAEHLDVIGYPAMLGSRLINKIPTIDLLLIDVPRLWHPLLGIKLDLILPAWVRQEIDIAPSAPPNQQILSRSTEREIKRHTRRENYSVEVSSDRKTLLQFFHEFYRPYVSARFGEQAVVVSESLFLERSHGQQLAKLFSGTQWVAGMLFETKKDYLRFGWFGASTNPPQAGAAEVIDGFCIRHAKALGIRRVIMGNSRPNLDDGIVRYKARFGARILPTRFPQALLGIRVLNWSEGVRSCLRKQRLLTQRNGQCFQYQLIESGSLPSVTLQLLAISPPP
jgi:hypothetical protein